ncbi:MAG: phage late control D family protein [Kofleriaceae bacterium]|nr:phage late control D family protein [Kofleriaceae bacterium]MBP6840995.1 phage late control D family protein [Kofleriaceae bacterium]MBP9203164.1 phage late control D family protein [Kofleriaceae bacterium]
MPDLTNRATAIKWKLDIGGPVSVSDIVSFVLEMDFNQPHMAVVVLKNDDHKYTPQCNHGDPMKLEVSENGGPPLFSGEVVGLEPQYKAGGESRLVVRAFCKLHKATRGKKTRNWKDRTDKQILQEVLGQAPEWKGPEINHRQVEQHNQSDLEFARIRASRLGCFIWTDGDKVMVKRPELDKDSGITFKVFENPNEGHRIKSFSPRMSSSPAVQAVEVRGWDPEKKEAIVKRVSTQPSPLGDKTSSSASGAQAPAVTYNVDNPVWSIEEAQALGEARIQEHGLSYITAEAECMGSPEYKPGIVITIQVNRSEDKFNGKYLVMGVTHRYTHGTNQSPDGGFTSVLRLARNAEVKSGQGGGA